MRKMFLSLAVIALSGFASIEAKASFILIDDFVDPVAGVDAIVTTSTTLPSQPAVASTGILGGFRTISVARSSSTGAAHVYTNDPNFSPSPSLTFAPSGNSVYTTTITYDAKGLGLGGVDLTTGGAQGILLTVKSADQGTQFKFTIYDTSGTAVDMIIKPLGVSATEVLYFSFGSFLPALNFTSVNKIALEIKASGSEKDLDWSITNIRTGIVPEPTSLALAGFAGIGMAVGAIRRRRQAKQAA